MTYAFFRPLLFCLSAETAHRAAILALKSGLLPAQPSTLYTSLQQKFWGLTFNNPVGIAAGFDKNAETMSGLSKQGFGYLEIGTVTPLPQSGNPKPRLFRLTEDEAVINRMGMPGGGLTPFIERMKKFHPHRSIPMGINIGKNKDSASALEDYSICLKAVYPFADYITLNISSPNTAGLRDLQHKHALEELLMVLLSTRRDLEKNTARRVPLILKVAPDLLPAEREDIAEIALKLELDGIIATNTTISRNNLRSPNGRESGGLSGKPLMQLSTEILRDFYRLTQGKIPLIGCGGIASAEDAYAKIRAGASLVQLYSAFVYQGFGLVREIASGLDSLLQSKGFSHISEAIGTDSK